MLLQIMCVFAIPAGIFLGIFAVLVMILQVVIFIFFHFVGFLIAHKVLEANPYGFYYTFER